MRCLAPLVLARGAPTHHRRLNRVQPGGSHDPILGVPERRRCSTDPDLRRRGTVIAGRSGGARDSRRSGSSPDERLDCPLRKCCRGISISPAGRCRTKGLREEAVLLEKRLEHSGNRGVAKGTRLALGGGRLRVRALPQDPGSSEHAPVSPRGDFLDPQYGASQEPAEGVRALQSRMRKIREAQFLGFRPSGIETRTPLAASVAARATRPVEPPERPWLTIQQERKAAQTRPGEAGSNKALLDPMREHVAHPSEKCLVVENWLGRVPPLPEGTTPPDERPDLLGDVRHQVLHESRQIPSRGAYDEVHVIGHEVEDEELHVVESQSSGQYTPEDFVRLAGRTEKEPTLKTAGGHEIDYGRLQHPDVSRHGRSPFCGVASAGAAPESREHA